MGLRRSSPQRARRTRRGVESRVHRDSESLRNARMAMPDFEIHHVGLIALISICVSLPVRNVFVLRDLRASVVNPYVTADRCQARLRQATAIRRRRGCTVVRRLRRNRRSRGRGGRRRDRAAGVRPRRTRRGRRWDSGTTVATSPTACCMARRNRLAASPAGAARNNRFAPPTQSTPGVASADHCCSCSASSASSG